MTGALRMLQGVTRRSQLAPCSVTLPAAWALIEMLLGSHGRPLQPGRDSSRWRMVTNLFWLVMKIPEATLHCVQYVRLFFASFVLLASILRTGQSFPCRALTEWAVMPGVCLKRLLQFVQFGIKKKIRLRNQTLTLRFLIDGLRVGDGGKNFILLLEKPSEQSQIETLI